MNEIIAKTRDTEVKSAKSSFSFHFLPVQPPISRWWWERSHLKHSLAVGELEISHLDYIRQSFDDIHDAECYEISGIS